MAARFEAHSCLLLIRTAPARTQHLFHGYLSRPEISPAAAPSRRDSSIRKLKVIVRDPPEMRVAVPLADPDRNPQNQEGMIAPWPERGASDSTLGPKTRWRRYYSDKSHRLFGSCLLQD